MYFFPNSYKNFNFLNINIYKLESFYALLIIPLWELAYRLIALFIYPRIYDVNNFDFDFIRKFITSSLKNNDPLVKGYNQFLLGILLLIWVIFVCVILVK